MKPLEVFIRGELIDLCIPTEEFARDSSWYSWFNDRDITMFLDQGVFPNTPQDQVEFFRNSINEKLILIISNKRNYCGTISLSNIDLQKKKAQYAIVVNKKECREYNHLIPLESMARLIEHSFLNIGLTRIEGGQHTKLRSWGQRLELLGFRVEGVKRMSFVKGSWLSDGIWHATTINDYRNIISKRGIFWDGADMMNKRLEKLPRVKYIDLLEKWYQTHAERYYQHLLEL